MFGIMIIWDYFISLASACLDSSLREKFTQLNKKPILSKTPGIQKLAY